MPKNSFTYVYILKSLKVPGAHYTGCTSNLKARIEKHNSGGVPHTSKSIPWRYVTVIRFRSADKARAFEKYLKSGSGRTFAYRHF